MQKPPWSTDTWYLSFSSWSTWLFILSQKEIKLVWHNFYSQGLAIFICTIQGDYQFHYMCDFCCFVFLFLKRIFQYTELRWRSLKFFNHFSQRQTSKFALSCSLPQEQNSLVFHHNSQKSSKKSIMLFLSSYLIAHKSTVIIHCFYF